MLKRWQITNFKSFYGSHTIDLSPINILAGPNSSGKSTIIQSILVLKQTLQYGAENRPLTLNGPLVRLGAFSDVRNYEARNGSLNVQFDIAYGDDELNRFPVPWARNLRRNAFRIDTESFREVGLSLRYQQRKEKPDSKKSRASNPTTFAPDLNELKISLSYALGSPETTRTSFATFRRKKGTVKNDESFPFVNQAYDIQLDEISSRELFSSKPEAKIVGSFLSYFLPYWIAVRYNVAAQRASKIAEMLCSPSSPGTITTRRFSDDELSLNVIDVINNWLQNNGGEPITRGLMPVPAEQAHRHILPVLRRLRRPIQSHNASRLVMNEKAISEIAQLKGQVLEVLLSEAEPEYDVELEMPKDMSVLTDSLKDYFKEGIRYLGPLRDSPRPVYQLEALESTTDVGYRGEHTAAVLDINSATSVFYHSPPTDGDADYVIYSERRRASLHDAVVEWMSYLGVAQDVVATEEGVFGNRLQVSTGPSGRLHDLTNVGVGVSQVLPIVVMALLAPPGSFLIFEQPELHLHPKVQARLADFFLALALDGKQCLLETHSEYLVDRFRLRIALSESDAVRPLVNILFSEKKGNRSSLIPIELSEFGSILNWPKDFFEQTQGDVARIIKATTDRRRLRPRV